MPEANVAFIFDRTEQADHNSLMMNQADLLSLVSAAHKAPSADNSQPLHFIWDGEVLSIRYDETRVEGRTFPADNPATILSVGAAVENIYNKAHQLNLSTDITWWPRGVSDISYYADIRFKKADSPINSATTNVDEAPCRHTNRFPYHKTRLPASTLVPLRQLNENHARLVIIDGREEIKKIGDIVRKASEIRFQTREVHEWLGESLRFSEKGVRNSDGLDVRTLGLPPGGTLLLRFIRSWKRMSFLNRFGLYKVLSRIDAAPVSSAPALMAIISPSGADDIVSAGRLLNRGWIYINSEQIAAHPYYVITDQLVRLETKSVPTSLIRQANTLKSECAALFNLAEGERLQMLLRLGYPKREAPPQSMRLPIEAIFTDLTAPNSEDAPGNIC